MTRERRSDYPDGRAMPHDRYRERRRRERSKTSSDWFRKTLLRATDHSCYLCGTSLCLDTMTIDHVIPRAKKGVDRNNRAPACAPCNVQKADRMPTGCERIQLLYINAILEREIDS